MLNMNVSIILIMSFIVNNKGEIINVYNVIDKKKIGIMWLNNIKSSSATIVIMWYWS